MPAEWGIRVIALWPMAPEGDEKGHRAYAIAQKSKRRSLRATALLDTEAEHSYMSHSFARSVMGADGLALAESASQTVLLGQVGTILRCDGSPYNQTESFLLADLDDVDIVLSLRSWNCLRQQCEQLKDSEPAATRPSDRCHDPSGTSPALQCYQEEEALRHRKTPDLFRHLSGRTYSEEIDHISASEATPSVAGSSHGGSWVHTPCSTPEALPSSPSEPHTDLCVISDAIERPSTLSVLSLGHHPAPGRRLPHTEVVTDGSLHDTIRQPLLDHPRIGQHDTNRDHFHQVWSWDPKKGNYFCRGRDKDDEWYWYPTDMV